MAKTKTEVIELILKESDFFSNVKRQWDKLNQEIESPNVLKITLEDWNNFTFQTYSQILDFLEFRQEDRPLLVPVHVDRDFEGYSCSFLPKEYEVCENVEIIRNGGKQAITE